MGTYHAAYYMVTNTTFTNGLATISFGNGPAEIDTWNPTENNPSYYLSLSRGTYLVVSVKDGCTIDKVIINKNSSDAVYLQADRGSYNTVTGTWTPGTEQYNQVGFYYSSSQAPVIGHVQVEFTEPSVVLATTAISPDPTAEEKPMSFDKMELTYGNANGSLSIQNATGITIAGDYKYANIYGSVNTTLTPTADGNKVILTLSPAITHDGTFTITVPEKSFKDSEGYENVGFTTTVTVIENRATFDTAYVKVLNAESEYVYLNNQDIYTFPEEIILEFPTNIGHIDGDARFRLFREGTEEPVAQMKLAAVDGEDKKAKLVFHSKSENTFAQGAYQLVVSSKVIFNSNYEDEIYERYNPEIVLKFNYTEAPDPLQPKWDKLAELKEKAAACYALIGQLGYPKTDVSPKTLGELKDIVAATTNENGELDAQITDLETAIKAFYGATDVVLPTASTTEDDGWYTITSVAKGSELPLHYENGAVTVGGTATAFQVQSITEAGVIVLKTVDGKYLHVLTTTAASTTTSDKNVTNTYMPAVNDLTIQKLKLAGDETDQEPVAGLFTIQGSLGRDASDNLLGTPTALVAHPAGTIITNAEDATLYFGTDKSSAFRFVSSSKPSGQTDPVSPKAELLGSTLDSNTKALTLVISGKSTATDIANVALATTAAPKFVVKNADGSEGDDVTSTFTGTAILEKLNDGDHNNYFKVNVNGLADGSYYLILPVGTFTYTENVTDERMKVEFTINSGSSTVTHNFKKDLAQLVPYSSSPYFDGDVAVNPTVLNDFRVYAYKHEGETEQTFFADTNKEVILAGYFNSQEYLRGHFVKDETYMSDQVWCYKIVWDREITANDFSDQTYNLGIKVLEATFGDKNFGAWLENQSSVSEEDCHVNVQFVTFVKVNSNAPTAEDLAAFANYQTEQQTAADGKAAEGDSEACAKLITDAKAAIGALEYDTTKSLAENKVRVDAIIKKLDTDLAAQRALDGFASYKTEQQTAADGKAAEGDSEACAKLITDAKAAIGALEYDATKSLAENKALVDAIISKLDTDLAAQRALDASKAALDKSIADATTYYDSIKEQYAGIANTLNSAIDAAKAVLNDATSTKSALDAAKETLEAAVETAKDAVATGISAIEVDGTLESVYTINGQKLNGKPTAKGLYIINGKKVVIK